MEIYNRFESDRKTAMINKDKLLSTTYKTLKGSIDGHCKDNKLEHTNEVVISVLEREKKEISKVLDEYIKYNKEELVSDTERTINTIDKYLPAKLDKESTIEIIKNVASTIEDDNVNKKKGMILKELASRKGELDWEFVVKNIMSIINP